MNLLIQNLDGSTRKLTIKEDRRGSGVYPFSADHPEIGQYFCFLDSILRRLDSQAVAAITICEHSYPLGIAIDFVYDRINNYRPVDIWTGEWL